MKFKTCQCPKDAASVKCVWTGVWFEWEGRVYTGDMFACRFCNALSVFGIPTRNGAPRAQAGIEPEAAFRGEVAVAEPFSRTGRGTIELPPSAVARMEKWEPFVLDMEREERP